LRLNGWQRIGIVASVLWAISGAFWGNNLGIHEGDWTVEAYKLCLEAPNSNRASCEKTFEKDWPVAISNHWVYSAFFGLVPIPLGWLVVYGVIALVRWIRTGFNRS
jgi:hypothetical protein